MCPRKAVSRDEGESLARETGCIYAEVIGNDAESFEEAMFATVRQRWLWQKGPKNTEISVGLEFNEGSHG